MTEEPTAKQELDRIDDELGNIASEPRRAAAEMIEVVNSVQILARDAGLIDQFPQYECLSCEVQGLLAGMDNGNIENGASRLREALSEMFDGVATVQPTEQLQPEDIASFRTVIAESLAGLANRGLTLDGNPLSEQKHRSRV